jgi:hypothetical protein
MPSRRHSKSPMRRGYGASPHFGPLVSRRRPADCRCKYCQSLGRGGTSRRNFANHVAKASDLVADHEALLSAGATSEMIDAAGAAWRVEFERVILNNITQIENPNRGNARGNSAQSARLVTATSTRQPCVRAWADQSAIAAARDTHGRPCRRRSRRSDRAQLQAERSAGASGAAAR